MLKPKVAAQVQRRVGWGGVTTRALAVPTEPERWSAAGPDRTAWRNPALGFPTVPAGPAGSPRPLPPTSVRRPSHREGRGSGPGPAASPAAQLTQRSPGDAAGLGRTTSAGTRVPDVKPLLRPLGPRRINNRRLQAGHLAGGPSGGPAPAGGVCPRLTWRVRSTKTKLRPSSAAALPVLSRSFSNS